MSNLYDIPLIIEDNLSEPKKTSKATIQGYVNKMQKASDKTFIERAINFNEEEINEGLKLRESLKKQKSQEKATIDLEVENLRSSMKSFLQSEEIFKTLFKNPKKQTLMLKSSLDNKHYRFTFELKPR